VVTGSGRERNRGNATLEERGKLCFAVRESACLQISLYAPNVCPPDNLLSTAILATPKSPKFGKGGDIDQSLHHIDACIKSPLDFGSPTMR
jgi:hypothetical protein